VVRLRKPVELVDPRLRSFRRDDWVQPGDGRFDPFWRWVAARRAWVAKHPNSQALGSKLDRFRDEIPETHPELYPRGATSWD
jgi:hypothetical protein